MDELLTISAAELAARIRRHEVSPVEVVDAHIARIERVNPAINGLIADRFARARDEARRAESRLMAATASRQLPPLLGVPCTIKEFLAVRGMPQTAGIMARQHVRAERNATVVARLVRAGAIVMGVSNVPEGGMWIETHNKIYGRTNNPWDLTRTAGGSSGGEGALVATGAAAFGIGSDIAGSIRIPAAFCGVVGHKPTGRMVPNTGHWGPGGATQRFMTSGPITRFVADLAPLLAIIAGPDGIDTYTRPWPAWSLSPALMRGDLHGITVYPMESNGAIRMSEIMRMQIRRATDALRARGARIAELHIPRVRSLLPIWAHAMSAAGDEGRAPTFAELLGDGVPVPLAREVARTLAGRSSLTVPALGLALIEQLVMRIPPRFTAGIAPPELLQSEIEAELGPSSVILHPPYPRPAPRHNAPLLRPFDFLCTCLFNITELPVTQVPTGFDERGLPVGVQVAAIRGNDALTMAVAAAIEADFGHWRPAQPPPVGQ